MFYVLDEDKNVVEVDNVEDWAAAFEGPGRTVKKTYGTFKHEEVEQRIMLSTVFLGLDHEFGDTPKVFETMAFKVDGDDHVTDWQELLCERHSTWNEAVTRHDKIVSELALTATREERD